MTKPIKRTVQDMIDQRAPEWLDRQVVRLGKDSTQLIDTGVPGILWARLANGKPIKVHVSGVNVPSRFDLRLIVGRKKSQPAIWQVITILEDYDAPAGGGELTYHHKQHEEEGGDRLDLSWKQIVARSVRVKDAAGFIVRVFGDPDLTDSGWVLIPSQDLDLSSYVPTTGALFVAIESDDNGALSINAGTGFLSPGSGTAANYPAPAAGKYNRALVLLFEGQTALLDEHIKIPKPPSFNPANYSDASHVHALDDLADVDAPSPADGDFLRWDSYADEWIAEGAYLDEILDVNAPSPADGDVLTWDAYAEEWVAEGPVGGSGVTGGDSHDHSGGDGAQIDHGGLAGLGDDDHTQYQLKSLLTTLGDIIYASASAVWDRLAGNTTTTRKFLRQTGNGSVSAAPAWDTLVAGDIPDISGTYAIAAKGVTNGDSHDHSGGDGAAIAYTSLTTVPNVPGGRLTLTTAVPITTTDVTGATTVYYTPYLHNIVALWTGSVWQAVTFSEVSLALGTVTSDLPYDVFGYLSGGTIALEKLAWTNGTTRATGISLQDGRYCKTGDKTRLYLGTFHTTSTTQTEDSESRRYLWNMYNRVQKHLICKDTTNSWSYTTTTWREANGNTTIGTGRAAVVVGLSEDELRAYVHSAASNSGGTVAIAAGVGIDSTTVNSAQVYGGGTGSAGVLGMTTCEYNGFLAAGVHFIQRLEISQASGTTTWYGDLNVTYFQTGMLCSLKS
jgi:hypothetical protein